MKTPDLTMTTTTTIHPPYTATISYQQQWKDFLSQAPPHIVIHDAIIIVSPSSLSLTNDQQPEGPGVRLVDPQTNATTTATQESLWIVACGSNGTIYVWTLTDEDGESTENPSEAEEGKEWEETSTAEDPNSSSSSKSVLQPLHQWKLHHGSLTKLQVVSSPIPTSSDPVSSFLPATASSRLFVAGEGCGILVFDWDRLVRDKVGGGVSVPPTAVTAHYTPYPSPHSTAPVVRDFVLQGNILTAAVGDAWGLYQWDLESGERISTTPALHRHGPAASLSQFETMGLLLVGADNGMVSIQRGPKEDWAEIDVRQLLLAAATPPLPTLPHAQSQHRPFRTRPDPSPELVLTGVEVVNDCWWTVAGHYATTTGSGGFVATVHAGTNVVVAKVDTPDIPQRLVRLRNPGGPTLLATTSNAPLVRVWDPVTLDPPAVWCTASIVTGHALASHNEYVVVGGVGGLLEVFHRSTRILALSCH